MFFARDFFFFFVRLVRNCRSFFLTSALSRTFTWVCFVAVSPAPRFLRNLTKRSHRKFLYKKTNPWEHAGIYLRHSFRKIMRRNFSISCLHYNAKKNTAHFARGERTQTFSNVLTILQPLRGDDEINTARRITNKSRHWTVLRAECTVVITAVLL